MHSWVFRHRARLAAIFGPPPAPAARADAPARHPRRLAGGRAGRKGPGTVDRGARHVMLRPMPPPVTEE
jgi:hypothetical protein